MKLTDLDPTFVRWETRTERRQFTDGEREVPVEYSIRVATLAEAQGVRFLCPACFAKNGGAVGTHGVEVAFVNRGVASHQGSQSRAGEPSRWEVSGNDLHDLTLHPSIDSSGDGGCTFHGFITNGDARW